MIRRTPISTRTDTLFPYRTVFRSVDCAGRPGDRHLVADPGLLLLGGAPVDEHAPASEVGQLARVHLNLEDVAEGGRVEGADELVGGGPVGVRDLPGPELLIADDVDAVDLLEVGTEMAGDPPRAADVGALDRR